MKNRDDLTIGDYVVILNPHVDNQDEFPRGSVGKVLSIDWGDSDDLELRSLDNHGEYWIRQSTEVLPLDGPPTSKLNTAEQIHKALSERLKQVQADLKWAEGLLKEAKSTERVEKIEEVKRLIREYNILESEFYD